MKTIQTIVGMLFLASSIFMITSCSETKELIESQVTEVEEAVTGSLTPLQRLHRVSLDANGNVVIENIPDGSIENKNVHVITHGWAPGYKPAVDWYAKHHPGETLLAWDPDAVADGERFFVGSFFPLAKSILEADRGSAVLVFSWIDISATETDWIGLLEGKDYDEFCGVEKRTRAVGLMMKEAVDAALKSGVPHELHLLGHSFGTKVVSEAGVHLKRVGYLDKIHITLFDSPERAPASCGDNRLYDVLAAFAPDRENFFVDNYISYWDECLSDKSKELDLIVDATIIPYGSGDLDSCQANHTTSWSECASCKHSAGVNWYTAATNDPSHDIGLWWSPLMGHPRVAKTLTQYYFKPYTNPVNIGQAKECKQDEVSTCVPD
ncbi:MAG: hypothetical protein AB8B56_19700 [Crocinitomicaceae bacterium]